MARLKEMYQNEIVEAMIKKFGYKNIMEVPKLDKIVINMGVGEAKDNAKVLDSAVRDLEIITGQKAVLTKPCGLDGHGAGRRIGRRQSLPESRHICSLRGVLSLRSVHHLSGLRLGH